MILQDVEELCETRESDAVDPHRLRLVDITDLLWCEISHTEALHVEISPTARSWFVCRVRRESDLVSYHGSRRVIESVSASTTRKVSLMSTRAGNVSCLKEVKYLIRSGVHCMQFCKFAILRQDISNFVDKKSNIYRKSNKG